MSLGCQIENHPLVLSVDPPHIWQLAPHSTSPSASNSRIQRRDSSPSSANLLPSSILIATLEVKVKNDASDADILDITNFCTERLATGLRLSGGRDSSADDDRTLGELSVSVKRSSGRKVVARFHNDFEASLEHHGMTGGHRQSHESHKVGAHAGHSHHH